MDTLLNNLASQAPEIIAAFGFFCVAENELTRRVEYRKVGGMRFLKVRYWGKNKVCISWCITQK